LLLMEFIDGESRFPAGAERHAAELLADLHSVTAPTFGLERDTLIGPLPQPNPPTSKWVEFFREHRLVYMARLAAGAGQIDDRRHDRVQRLADALPRLIEEPDAPSLLHGDVWTTNVLARGDRITGFIDPAVYYGHAEIELAFTSLFGTFTRGFYGRYAER